MIYINPKLYKDRLTKTELFFIHKGKDKRDYEGRHVWQPVKKIFPFMYKNIKPNSAFVDYFGNFAEVKR